MKLVKLYRKISEDKTSSAKYFKKHTKVTESCKWMSKGLVDFEYEQAKFKLVKDDAKKDAL